LTGTEFGKTSIERVGCRGIWHVCAHASWTAGHHRCIGPHAVSQWRFARLRLHRSRPRRSPPHRNRQRRGDLGRPLQPSCDDRTHVRGTVSQESGRSLHNRAAAPNLQLPFPIFAAVFAEVIGTMILVMTVLGSTDPSEPALWKPSAIGLSLAAVIWGLGAISGASLNPARSFGPSVVSLVFDPSAFNYYWIYLVGPILGGLLAAELYRVISRSGKPV